ncbi:MAG TPA: hypothetical protein VM370_08740 [Candidatus Thermoplasmatota archaeon]|nr:hypothetical protein [Candidatus Thermoplasmatota archaeon]
MRILALLLLVCVTLPHAAAQDADVVARLALAVGSEHEETMVLAFEGLHKLTQYRGLCLPERARETKVYDALGAMPYDAKDEGGRRTISFVARTEKVTVEMARAGPGSADHPLYAGDINFCVPEDSRVEVEVGVPEGHTLFFLSDGGRIADDARHGTVAKDGPTHVFYTYEAPLGSGRALDVFDEGPFRIYAQPALADRAREVARLATAPFDAALAEAGLTRPFDTLRVRYARETPFPWEAGHYNGHGFVQVKESSLDEDASKGYPYVPVKLLVHEAFHAASFPYGQGDVEETIAWWLEGTARHAERQVDATMPNATNHCEKEATRVTCWSFDDRITIENATAGYRSDFTFDRDWEPSAPQDDDTRTFYYGYSELVVGAWIAQRGEPGYRSAWDTIDKAFATGDGCPCKDGWIEEILDDDSLFRPWESVRTSDPAGFDARVRPFVKDEAALQAAVDAEAGPLAGLGIPAPAWIGLAALGCAVALTRRRA